MLVRRALESVAHQTYANWRLVLVNTAGDRSVIDWLVEKFLPNDDRVEVLDLTGSWSAGSAYNAGLRRLETELATVHDDTDSWAPEMLSVAVQVLASQRRRYPAVRGVTVCANVVFEHVCQNHIQFEQMEPWGTVPSNRASGGFVDLATLISGPQFPSNALLFDRTAAEDLGGFDEELAANADWEFALRLVSKHDVCCHPEFLAFCHIQTGQNGDIRGYSWLNFSDEAAAITMVRNRWLRAAMDGSETEASIVESLVRTSTTDAGFHRVRPEQQSLMEVVPQKQVERSVLYRKALNTLKDIKGVWKARGFRNIKAIRRKNNVS